jgi:hypothetical protein
MNTFEMLLFVVAAIEGAVLVAQARHPRQSVWNGRECSKQRRPGIGQ